MNRFLCLWAVCISLLASLVSCHVPVKERQLSQLKMAGSTTLDPVMNLTIETYKRLHPELALSYEALGSSVGLKELENGTVDLAGSSRELNQEELSRGLVMHPIALDGLAVIVNKQAGLKNLSLHQLADIFSGNVTNWKDVGGNDCAVILVKRDESSGTYTSFHELVLKGKDYAEEGLVVNSNGDAMSKVVNTLGSIAYIGMSYLSDIDRSKTRVVAIENVLPNEKSIAKGTYPLSRELYLVSKGKQLSPLVKDFLNFILSGQGQDLVLSAGFFPIADKQKLITQ